MKKKMIWAVLAIMVLIFASCGTTDANNPRDSINWAGLYTGVIPAASSPGINAEITLNSDNTYKVIYQYINRSTDTFIYNGNFKWNRKGDTITLNTKEIPPHYRVEGNRLIQLDLRGNVITGDLANNYILTKKP